MTIVFDLLAVYVDFESIDTLGLIPSCTQYFRVELDERIEIVFLGEILEVLIKLVVDSSTERWKASIPP